MNLQEIEKLLDKYFEGDTSLSEELQLRDFFASGDVPERWKNLEKYFLFLGGDSAQQLNDPGFDARIMSEVREEKQSSLLDLHRPWIYWISGIAATVLILIAVFVKFDPFSKRIGDTYDDPQLAYVEAKKILMYVSAQFNKGTSKLESVKAYETGLKELKPVAAYSKAADEVKRLDEVEKVNKMITRN
jgi:hypothetical protein